MALVTANRFGVLTDVHCEDVASKLITNVSRKAPTSMPAKKNKKKQEAAKKRQPTREAVMINRANPKPIRRPKQKVQELCTPMQNQPKEERTLTLKEYENMLLEKKKALNVLKKPDVEREVSLHKDFESMKLVGKKKRPVPSVTTG